MKHPTEIIGFTSSMQDIAKEIAMLRYDKLHEFMVALSQRLAEDGQKGLEAGKSKLAGALINAAGLMHHATIFINEANVICSPYNN